MKSSKGIAKARRHTSGGGLLDSLMSSTSNLHSSLPPPRRAGAASLDDDAVASPYLFAPGSIAGSMPTSAVNPGQRGQEICKNPECQRTDFEVDTRHGDRICNHCGAVQNSRSIESLEEEHRTFADDDKSEGKKRAEVSRDGRTGGAVSGSLTHAQSVANTGAPNADGLLEKDSKKLDKIKDKLKDLASVMGLSASAAHNAAVEEGKRYIHSCVAHASMCHAVNPIKFDEQLQCQRPMTTDEATTARKACRFSKEKPPAYVAAALMKLGLQKEGHDRQMAEMADFMKRIGEESASQTSFGQVMG